VLTIQISSEINIEVNEETGTCEIPEFEVFWNGTLERGSTERGGNDNVNEASKDSLTFEGKSKRCLWEDFEVGEAEEEDRL
jgi:hypothetical protein